MRWAGRSQLAHALLGPPLPTLPSSLPLFPPAPPRSPLLPVPGLLAPGLPVPGLLAPSPLFSPVSLLNPTALHTGNMAKNPDPTRELKGDDKAVCWMCGSRDPRTESGLWLKHPGTRHKVRAAWGVHRQQCEAKKTLDALFSRFRFIGLPSVLDGFKGRSCEPRQRPLHARGCRGNGRAYTDTCYGGEASHSQVWCWWGGIDRNRWCRPLAANSTTSSRSRSRSRRTDQRRRRSA